jgi:hypothetical protein
MNDFAGSVSLYLDRVGQANSRQGAGRKAGA